MDKHKQLAEDIYKLKMLVTELLEETDKLIVELYGKKHKPTVKEKAVIKKYDKR